MSNIEYFNKGAALILDRLYQAFPERISFTVNDLEENADEHLLKIYSESVIFLEKEGFLRFNDSMRPFGEDTYTIWFSEVVLTSKGLSILGSVPDVLEEKLTLGQKLHNAVQNGSIEILKVIVNQVVSSAVSGYLKSIIS